jgi:hypothetical protein
MANTKLKGRERFEMANVTHDGRLTLAQAQASNWFGVVRHFQDIDRDHKGYVTWQDIREFHRAMKAEHAGGGAPPPGASYGGPPGGPPPPPPPQGQQY